MTVGGFRCCGYCCGWWSFFLPGSGDLISGWVQVASCQNSYLHLRKAMEESAQTCTWAITFAEYLEGLVICLMSGGCWLYDLEMLFCGGGVVKIARWQTLLLWGIWHWVGEHVFTTGINIVEEDGHVLSQQGLPWSWILLNIKIIHNIRFAPSSLGNTGFRGQSTYLTSMLMLQTRPGPILSHSMRRAPTCFNSC